MENSANHGTDDFAHDKHVHALSDARDGEIGNFSRRGRKISFSKWKIPDACNASW
jgi:hypothetical protein